MTFTFLKWSAVLAMSLGAIECLNNALNREHTWAVAIDIVAALMWAICAVSMARCKVVES